MSAQEVEVVGHAGGALASRGLQATSSPSDPSGVTPDYVRVGEGAKSSGYYLHRSDPAPFYDGSAQESPHDCHAALKWKARDGGMAFFFVYGYACYGRCGIMVEPATVMLPLIVLRVLAGGGATQYGTPNKKQESWCRLDFLFENGCVLH